jgi:hypothetical protein
VHTLVESAPSQYARAGLQLEAGKREVQDAHKALELERLTLKGQLTVLSRQHASEYSTAERSWKEQLAHSQACLSELQLVASSAVQAASGMCADCNGLHAVLQQVWRLSHRAT